MEGGGEFFVGYELGVGVWVWGFGGREVGWCVGWGVGGNWGELGCILGWRVAD